MHRFIERRGEIQYLKISFGGCANDHLRALPCRRECARFSGRAPLRHITRIAPHKRPRIAIFGDALANLAHGRNDGIARFIRAQKRKAFARRQLHIHADSIGEKPERCQQIGRRSRNRLRMNVAAKAIFLAKDAQTLDNALRRVIGALQNPARKKQALDVIAPVELHGEVGQFTRPKRSARNIVGAAARTIGAIENAHVGEQHFQKRDAAPVG